MKKRILAVGMAFLMLTGCGVQRTEPLTEEPKTEGNVIAYVPLDDRPDNAERVVYLAESLGYRLELPEKDTYTTRLRGQPLNNNGTQYGDRGTLFQWIMQAEEDGCDRYVLSMDQLLSGGLVNSRSMSEHESITMSDGTQADEQEMMTDLLEVLAKDSNNQVWILDSVMRLAPTVGYDHWDLNGYNALRAYGMEGRPVLKGTNLTVEQIYRDYRLGSDGTELPISDFSLNEEEVTEYLGARRRKLELSAAVQKQVAQPGYEQFHVLIGIDDSSQEDSIQKNEIACLRQGLRSQDALLSGVDDLAFKAVTRLYQEETGAFENMPAAYVQYYGGTENLPACDYDYQALTCIMKEHFEFFQLKQAETPEEAAMQILVLTQPADESRKADYCDDLIDQLLDNQQKNCPTVIIDAGNGRYGTLFHEKLTDKADLGWLLSYSGFLDMAIVTGTALSHGVARMCRLEQGNMTEASERAFLRTLADSVVKDFCYKHIVREDILNYVRNDLSGSPDNFWEPPLNQELLHKKLEQSMDKTVKPVLRNLERSNFITGMKPYQQKGWGGIELTNYSFPWNRAFEIGMEIRLGSFTAEH